MMINPLTNRVDLRPLISQSPTDILTSTLTTELQDITVQPPINQFSDERVGQLLQQQLGSLITISSHPNINEYPASDEELALLTVFTSQQEGLLNNENSDELMARLKQSVTGIHAAYANTSDILASLGQLGSQQKSFIASSEQRVERALGYYMETTERLNNDNDDNYRFELSVTTKEGDIINITFNSSQAYDEENGETVDGFGLSYQVEGSLSEAEHQALTEILADVGAMADEFFKVDKHANNKYTLAKQSDISLDFVTDFNHQQLASFDVSFSTTDGNTETDSENRLDLSYQFDEASKQQAIDFEWKDGIKQIGFALDMSIFGGSDVNQMAQYLATLDKNLEDSRDNSKDTNGLSPFNKDTDSNMRQGFDLFKGALTNMSSIAQRYSKTADAAAQQFTNGRAMVADLVDNMITNDPRYQGPGNETNNTLGTGISKLADFEANYSFSLESWGSLRPKIGVELSQVTELDKLGDLSGLTQNKDVNTGFKYQSGRPDYYEKTENYQVSTAVKNRQLTGLDQHHQVNVDQQTYRPSKNPYQYDLMLALTEETINDSSIRLIDDIWLETTENSHNMEKKERVIEYGKDDDFKETSHQSHDKFATLIGDLDKLAKDKIMKRNYLIELVKVNSFMVRDN